jgi:hypothetical protein
VGLPMELWTLIYRAVVAGATMTGRPPLRPEGPLGDGVPPLDKGLGHGALEAP